MRPGPDTPLDAIRRTIRHLEERGRHLEEMGARFQELQTMCEDDNEGEAVRGVRQELIRGIGNRAEDAASTAALLRGYLDSIGEPHDPSGPGWPPGGSP